MKIAENKRGELVLLRKNRKKEVLLGDYLIAVSVLSLILSVVMLFFSDWAINTDMTKLDAYAKTIYMDLQDQLSAKRADGSLEGFHEELSTRKPERFLTKIPQDYDINEFGKNWEQLCYLRKDDAITQGLLTEKLTTYHVEGNYLVELNPATGEVYGVFYWEKNKPLEYSVIEKLSGRTISNRSNKKIGYYGGNTENIELSRGVRIKQEVELINGEELYLKVKFKNSRQMMQKQYDVSIALSIEDEHGNMWFAEKAHENATKVALEDTLTYYILLDSLENGKSFKEITQDKLVAGDNISITVESEVSKDFVHSIEISKVKGNSLFADKTNGGGTTLKVATLRHLRNLDDRYHKYQSVSSEENVKIVQLNDIDFDNKNYDWKDGKYKGEGQGEKPAFIFEPIKNDAVFNNTGIDKDVAEYDGDGFVLKNFVITATKDNAGLFSTAKNACFRNINLEDLTVQATNQNNVGGLIGSMVGGQVIDCTIYLQQFTFDEDIKKFCIFQPANDSRSFENRMAEKTATMRISGGNNVGGLIGSADGTTILTSTVSINVLGNANVGGFVGNAVRLNLKTSFAGGDVYANTNRGNFFGVYKDVIAENSNGDGFVFDYNAAWKK